MIKSFDESQFKAVIERIGSLGLTESHRKEILKAIDEKLEEQRKVLKPTKEQFGEKAFASLEKQLAELSKGIADAATQKATEIMSGRIPMDLTAEVKKGIENFGAIANQLDEYSQEVFDDVTKFHEHVVNGRYREANAQVKDIVNQEESTELDGLYNTLREAYGNRREIKKLRKQINAIKNINKVFARQYAPLDGRNDFGVWWDLHELAEAYIEADKRTGDAIRKHTIGANELDINLAPHSMGDEVINHYKEKIARYSHHLTAEEAKRSYLDQPELREQAIENQDFERIADEAAREALSGIPGDFDPTKIDEESLRRFKQITSRRARELVNSFKEQGYMVAGVVQASFTQKLLTERKRRDARRERNELENEIKGLRQDRKEAVNELNRTERTRGSADRRKELRAEIRSIDASIAEKEAARLALIAQEETITLDGGEDED